MKETLLLQARYNQFADRVMFDILKKVSQDDLQKDCGLYYKSICRTIEHSLCANIGLFLGKIAPLLGVKTPEIEKLTTYLQPDFTLKDDIVNDILELEKLQERVDTAIINVIKSTDDFKSIETLQLSKDFSVSKSRMHLILALLNHATHHRGQIAGALDILGVDNDFAGMLGL